MMVTLKWIDAEKAIRYGFKWISNKDYLNLGIVFFFAQLIGDIIEHILILSGLLLVVLILYPNLSLILPYLHSSSYSWLNEGSIGSMIDIVLSVILVGIAYFVITSRGMLKNKKFKDIFSSVIKSRLLVILMYTVAVLIVLLTGIQIVNSLLNNNAIYGISIASQFMTLLLSSQGFTLLIGLILGLILLIIGSIIWTYVIGYFLIAQIFKINGVKSEFVNINLKNIVAYVKLTIVLAFTTLFNFISKKMLYIQLGLIVIGVIFGSVAFLSVNTIITVISAIICLLAVIAYLLTVIYNTYRFNFTVMGFVKDGGSTISAMKNSWELTRFYVLSIFLTNIASSIIVLIMVYLFMIPAAILSGLSAFVNQITPLWSAINVATIALVSIVATLTTVLITMNMYSQLLSSAKKKPLPLK